MLTWSTPAFCILDFPSSRCAHITGIGDIPPIQDEASLLLAEITDPTAEDGLQMLAAHLGTRLLVPEVWRDILPQCGIVISAAISGGQLKTRLRQAADASPGRCWLLAEPMQMLFNLPCPSGCGRTLSREEKDAFCRSKMSFYTKDLCCRYCYAPPDGVVLFDTEQTLADKIRLAEHCGFHGALVRTILR